jgi:hypothetical protein
LKLEALYTNKIIVIFVQILTIVLISLSVLDVVFKIMLVFGYVMLFRQERWHKHLFIMLLMIMILFVSSGGFSTIMVK